MKNLRERALRGDTLFGCFVSLGYPLTTEIMANAGYDWVLIDLEHGAGDEREVLHQLQAVEHTAACAVIRVEGNARQRVHRVLDLGAHGIMFPRMDTVEEARAAVAAMRYPPEGVRGVAFSNRACGFGANFREYMAAANSSLVGVVQIETETAVANAAGIAAIDGVDVLFVGPSDLSHSMGMLGQFDHPRFVAAIDAVGAAARQHGKAAGILLPKPDDCAFYLERGYRFLASGNDGVLLTNAARNVVRSLRATAGQQ